MPENLREAVTVKVSQIDEKSHKEINLNDGQEIRLNSKGEQGDSKEIKIRIILNGDKMGNEFQHSSNGGTIDLSGLENPNQPYVTLDGTQVNNPR